MMNGFQEFTPEAFPCAANETGFGKVGKYEGRDVCIGTGYVQLIPMCVVPTTAASVVLCCVINGCI